MSSRSGRVLGHPSPAAAGGTLSADGGTLAFGPGGGTVALELDGMADSETYLWLRNIRWTGAEWDDSTRITVRSEAGASLRIIDEENEGVIGR